jgi:hypothetical protein
VARGWRCCAPGLLQQPHLADLAAAAGAQVRVSRPPAVAAAGTSSSTGSSGRARKPWASCPPPAVSRTGAAPPDRVAYGAVSPAGVSEAGQVTEHDCAATALRCVGRRAPNRGTHALCELPPAKCRRVSDPWRSRNRRRTWLTSTPSHTSSMEATSPASGSHGSSVYPPTPGESSALGHWLGSPFRRGMACGVAEAPGGGPASALVEGTRAHVLVGLRPTRPPLRKPPWCDSLPCPGGPRRHAPWRMR